MISRIFSKSLTHLTSICPQFSTYKQRKSIKLVAPVLNQSVLLYAKKKYSEGKHEKSLPFILWISPSIWYGVQRFMEGWSTGSICLEIFLIIIGLISSNISKIVLGKVIQAIEINQNHQKLLITVPRNPSLNQLIIKQQIQHLDLKKIRTSQKQSYYDTPGFYFPKKNPKPLQKQEQVERVMSQKQWINQEFLYWKIIVPLQQIKSVDFLLTKVLKEQLEKDKDSMTFEQFLAKYGKFDILLTISTPNSGDQFSKLPETIQLILKPSQCTYCTRYFEAMIYGAKIQLHTQENKTSDI